MLRMSAWEASYFNQGAKFDLDLFVEVLHGGHVACQEQ